MEQTKGKKSLRIGKVNDRFQAQMLYFPIPMTPTNIRTSAHQTKDADTDTITVH